MSRLIFEVLVRQELKNRTSSLQELQTRRSERWRPNGAALESIREAVPRLVVSLDAFVSVNESPMAKSKTSIIDSETQRAQYRLKKAILCSADRQPRMDSGVLAGEEKRVSRCTGWIWSLRGCVWVRVLSAKMSAAATRQPYRQAGSRLGYLLVSKVVPFPY